jgi:hypothetical protein
MRRVVFLALAALAAMLPGTTVAADSSADVAMAKQIGQRLEQSGQLQGYQIGVKYLDGVVWLGGTVASEAQRDAAIRLTQNMPGVFHVESRLSVSRSRSTGGSEIVRAFDTAEVAPRRVTPAAATAQPLAAAAAPQAARRPRTMPRSNMPRPAGRMRAPAVVQAQAEDVMEYGMEYGTPMTDAGTYSGMGVTPTPSGFVPGGSGRAISYDNAQMPGYAWPSYAAYPNYAALTYPQQYSPTAWPYIGPFYPYPQVPLAWRKVSLEWDDGWWFLDFSAHNSSH